MFVLEDLGASVVVTDLWPAVGHPDSPSRDFERVNPEELLWIVLETYSSSPVMEEVPYSLWMMDHSRTDLVLNSMVQIKPGTGTHLVSVPTQALYSTNYVLTIQINGNMTFWDITLFGGPSPPPVGDPGDGNATEESSIAMPSLLFGGGGIGVLLFLIVVILFVILRQAQRNEPEQLATTPTSTIKENSAARKRKKRLEIATRQLERLRASADS